jgi:hypothetical protein
MMKQQRVSPGQPSEGEETPRDKREEPAIVETS